MCFLPDVFTEFILHKKTNPYLCTPDSGVQSIYARMAEQVNASRSKSGWEFSLAGSVTASVVLYIKPGWRNR